MPTPAARSITLAPDASAAEAAKAAAVPDDVPTQAKAPAKRAGSDTAKKSNSGKK